MKLLIVNWGAYTHKDIYDTLNSNNIFCKVINYCFGDKNSDTFFSYYFSKYISEDIYDAVFTVNYFPIIAETCHQHNIKYLSWSYDNPLNVQNIEATLSYETNYVFLFDRIQVENFNKKGYGNVFHLPLAVNAKRLDKIILTTAEQQHFGADISFVGKLYPSTFSTLISPLSEYHKGYLEGIVEAQLQVYGYYFIDELLTPSIIQSINENFLTALPNSNFNVTKEELSYSLSTYITRKERLLLLAILSKLHTLKLYSREQLSILDKAIYMGSAKYLSDMPKIFKSSNINLNITLKMLQSGIPLRVMDILGCGGFLFSNYQPELSEYFIDNTDFVSYISIEDAIEKAGFYLNHHSLREQIAQNGYNKIVSQFSYEIQLKKLFTISGIV